MEDNWIRDTKLAPKSHYETYFVKVDGKQQPRRKIVEKKIIVATHCKQVLTTQWLPDAGRWEFLKEAEEFVAWQPYPDYPEAS